MNYKTKKQAYKHIKTTFNLELQKKHKVVKTRYWSMRLNQYVPCYTVIFTP